MKIFKFIIFLLFGLMFINAGLNKFFNYKPMQEMSEVQKKSFEAFIQIKWLMPLVATIEIIAGALFISNKFRALAAIMILPIMIGILLHHTIVDQSTIIIALVLFIINVWAIIDNYKKYKVLIT